MEHADGHQATRSQVLGILLFATVAVLVVVAPRLLALVFLKGAVGGMFSVKRELSDPDLAGVLKVVLVVEWVACWLLTFGFGFEWFNMQVVGLLFAILANVLELWHEPVQKQRIVHAAWVLLCGFMLADVILRHLGSTISC